MIIKIHSGESGAFWILKKSSNALQYKFRMRYLFDYWFISNEYFSYRKGFEAAYNKSPYIAKQWKMKSERDSRIDRVQKLSEAVDCFKDLLRSCGTSPQKSITMQIGTKTLKSIHVPTLGVLEPQVKSLCIERGVPGWLSRLNTQRRLRSWSHDLWVRAPRRAPCWQLRVEPALDLCLPLSLSFPCSCSVSLSLSKINKC